MRERRKLDVKMHEKCSEDTLAEIVCRPQRNLCERRSWRRGRGRREGEEREEEEEGDEEDEDEDEEEEEEGEEGEEG